MDPVLLSFHTPAHDLDLVSRHVVKSGVETRLAGWKAASGAQELVYVATCQRVMWLLWGGDPAGLDLDAPARRYEGEAAWSHLLSVAAGLQSANLGDREVPGQLREGLFQGRLAGVAGAEAAAVVEDVIREAQRLRDRLGLADGHVSVATAALKHLQETLAPGTPVAVVGVGPMSAYLAERLPGRGFPVTLANRTQTRAEALAAPLGLPVVPLARLQEDPAGFGAVVTATGSPDPLFTLGRWASVAARPELHLLDLALPPDSEPALETLPWVRRVDLAAFLAATATARAQRAEASGKAEPFLQEAAGRLRKRARDRQQKRDLADAQARLDAAWADLQVEAGAAALPPEVLDHVASVVHRGRTLAHRALAQSQIPLEPGPDRLDAGEG